MSEWIKVTEKLPEANYSVLARDSFNFFYELCLINNKWEFFNPIFMEVMVPKDITHWQYKLNPPKD